MLQNKQLYINMYDHIHRIFLMICKQRELSVKKHKNYLPAGDIVPAVTFAVD